MRNDFRRSVLHSIVNIVMVRYDHVLVHLQLHNEYVYNMGMVSPLPVPDLLEAVRYNLSVNIYIMHKERKVLHK